MSEKEKEREKEMEEEVLLDHWSHEHPLTLVDTSVRDYCDGCCRYFSSGEAGYGCSKKCGYEKILHQECAEAAKKIIHPMHPQHTLNQQSRETCMCAVCDNLMWGMIGYYCTSLKCLFRIHVGCGLHKDVIDVIDSNDDDEQGRIIHHRSHPQHELRLLRRAKASCSFKCDACGTTQKGSSYICILCQYWIHERCAYLDNTIKREDHHHSLSLSFSVPHEYILFDYKCDVCHKHLVPKYWIYHCETCRYIVHVKCAFMKSLNSTIINLAKDIVWFPMNDVADGLIRPFIMREGGAIAPIPNDDEMVNAKYEFHGHKHKLSLISSSPNDENEERETGDDDYGTTSEIICDGCITPIFKKNQRSSSSSSSSDKCYYMSCSECNFFLHYVCFHLPPELPSLPLIHPEHNLVLYSCPKLDFKIYCYICNIYSNGLFYACQRCSFIVDIKCASLPDTIYHKAHPQHLLRIHDMRKYLFSYRFVPCGAGCGWNAREFNGYMCDDCGFMLHNNCAMLLTSTKHHEWDMKHTLPLTYDAHINHPGEFYCNHCEEQMNPKMWMYHCRPCDLSFHPNCIPSTASYCRNFKFGHQYVNVVAHPHPLSFQLLTSKRRCDDCHEDRFCKLGFHCASCNFFICLDSCGEKMLGNGDIQSID